MYAVNSFKWKHYEGEIFLLNVRLYLKICIKLYKFKRNNDRKGDKKEEKKDLEKTIIHGE